MTIEKNFKIKGMTCAACVRAVERAVNKKDGILDANVNLATEKMMVKYNEEEVSQDEIVEAVSKAGYEALLDEELKEVVIPVEGMT
ncbi:copper ion binding protein [Maledivibacter halophilus]|uniref:Copper ion binding protein n=2 Tax=Maledivibacter halophilus TaxID=36842 RepID=A0A1T5M587_9FIRM|nr:heavy metal-associated domain-containing protein [Maledivibacter halophilus]SKC83293.1 copper ion binding protein [Maledivibacter halophilus]